MVQPESPLPVRVVRVIGPLRRDDSVRAAQGVDLLVGQVAAELEGRSFVIADEQRAVYHAAACVASNHVIALLDHFERPVYEAIVAEIRRLVS